VVLQEGPAAGVSQLDTATFAHVGINRWGAGDQTSTKPRTHACGMPR